MRDRFDMNGGDTWIFDMDVIAFVLQMLESGSVDLMAFMRAVYCFVLFVGRCC